MSSSNSSGRGSLLGVLGVLAASGYIVYHYLAGILFFGFFLVLDAISLYLICKMDISEEAKRLGKKSHAILGLLGLLAVQIVLMRHSTFVDSASIDFERVERVRSLISTYGLAYIVQAVSFFSVAGIILYVIYTRYPKNPPILLRYLLGVTASWGSACLMYGFFAKYGIVFVDISRDTYALSGSYLAIDVRGAERELLVALFCMYLLMSRLRFQNGEQATVHCCEEPIYVMTRHGSLIVPVFSATLHLLFQLIDQHPIFISVDFGTIRPELRERIEIGVTRHVPGEHRPTRLDGVVTETSAPSGGSDSSLIRLASHKPANPKGGGLRAEGGEGLTASKGKVFNLDQEGKPSFEEIKDYLRGIGKR